MAEEKSDKAEQGEQDQNMLEPQRYKKIIIGRLAVDPVFLLLFLFFGTCSLLMLMIMFSSM